MKILDEIDFPLRDETFLLVGIAMEVHRELGCGFSEVVYKDAFENELIARNLSFEREKEFTITYKGNVLPHTFRADFVFDSKVIVEVKALSRILDEHYHQVLNYSRLPNAKSDY